MNRRAAKAAFPVTLPVMAGYLVLGLGFGVLMSARGFHPGYALLMSVFIYAGSMQYVAVELLSGGATLLAAALMTLLINARHLFYGVSMLKPYRGAGANKLYLIFSLTDETYSLLCRGDAPEGVDRHRYYLFVSLFNQCYWVAGTLLGSLAGELLPFDLRGIEFSMTALFLVIFTDQWLTSRDRRPAVIGVVCSVISLLLFGPEGFILPAMGMILLCLAALKKPLSQEVVP